MQQPAFSSMDSLEFPELHEESVGVLAFSRNLYKTMRAAGIHDFSLRVSDLLSQKLPFRFQDA